MSNAATDYFVLTIESALEKLQQKIIQQKKITADDVLEALAQDVANGITICPVHFTRFVCHSQLLSKKDLEAMTSVLVTGMTNLLPRDPETFLSYAKAATICARKL